MQHLLQKALLYVAVPNPCASDSDAFFVYET